MSSLEKIEGKSKAAFDSVTGKPVDLAQLRTERPALDRVCKELDGMGVDYKAKREKDATIIDVTKDNYRVAKLDVFNSGTIMANIAGQPGTLTAFPEESSSGLMTQVREAAQATAARANQARNAATTQAPKR